MGMNLGLTKCQLITYIHFTEITPFTSITHNYLGKYIYALALAGGRGAGMGSSSAPFTLKFGIQSYTQEILKLFPNTFLKFGTVLKTSNLYIVQ